MEMQLSAIGAAQKIPIMSIWAWFFSGFHGSKILLKLL